MPWLIFAEEGMPFFAGASGWAGAGLLGLVLGWLLLVHLPGKDKQFDKFMSDKDAQVKDLITQQRNELATARQDFKESLKTVVDHCEKEIARAHGLQR